MLLKKILFSILLFTFGSKVFGSQLNLKIYLPGSINSEKLLILIDNGYEEKIIDIKFKDNIAIINQAIYSHYASIVIVYPNNYGRMSGQKFLVNTDINSFIKFKETNESDTNRLSKFYTKNAKDITKIKEFRSLKKYCKVEVDSNIYYSIKYNEIKNDSILNLYNVSSKKLAAKRLNYLQTIKIQSFFYSWFFRTEIAPTLRKTNTKELLYFFDNNLPESYQKSDEGKFLRERLFANLYVKEGEKAPLFNTIDYKGDSVSLQKFKGKYVLVDFWATWCSPCIEKIPTIKQMRNDYDNNYLQIISVSYDKDSTKFINGINNYELNWLHIFNNLKIRNAYGDTPIPALYLIDPNGIICYSSWENSIDKIFEILNKSKK